MKLGIMQPYLFPYIGYFQLINAVDQFVIYDDVQFIKSGWINRNKILINGAEAGFILNIKKDSTQKNINERIFVDNIDYYKKKFLRTIEITYGRAPYFNAAFQVVNASIYPDERNLSKAIIKSLVEICEYLHISTKLLISSEIKSSSIDVNLTGVSRVIHINKLLEADHYINPIGGIELYSHEKFKNEGIRLSFVKTNPIKYEQFNSNFVPNLSIIDVMMFNSPEKINSMLDEYELI